MKKFFKILAGITTIIFIATVIVFIMNGKFWQITPWIAHNRPQGVMGWSFCTIIVLWIIALIIPKKRSKKSSSIEGDFFIC